MARAADVLLALLLLPAVAVVVGCLALPTRLMTGSVFHWQERVGRRGTTFHVLKLCTVDTRDKTAGPVVPKWGRWLRATHVDEAPQLLQVIPGQMSIVGPRPIWVGVQPEYERGIRGYRRRLAVRPGLTGLDQVLYYSDAGHATLRRSFAADRWYIRNRSWRLDVWILWRTTAVVLRGAAIGTGMVSSVFLERSKPPALQMTGETVRLSDRDRDSASKPSQPLKPSSTGLCVPED